MIYIIATLTCKPNSLATIMELAMPCIESTRLEKGCISYDLLQSQTDKNVLTFVERWENQEAIDAHFQEPHLIAWREAGAPYFTDRKVEIITPKGVVVL